MNVSIKTIQAIMEGAVTSHKRATVSDIERVIGYYRQSWGEQFKADTGLSPNEYVRRFRMRCVCHALVETRDTILSISELYGRSLSYFCRDFKKTFSLTPSEFRSIDQDARAVVLRRVFSNAPFLTEFK